MCIDNSKKNRDERCLNGFLFYDADIINNSKHHKATRKEKQLGVLGEWGVNDASIRLDRHGEGRGIETVMYKSELR